MRFWTSFGTVAAIFMVSGGPATSDDLETQRKAIQLIREMAEDICPAIIREGGWQSTELSGDAKAKLGTIVGKIAGLGIEGAGKYTSEEYKNVLQQDLAPLIQNNTTCRLDVFKLLQEKMISPVTIDSSASSKRAGIRESVPSRSPTAGSASLERTHQSSDFRTQLSEAIKVVGRYAKYNHQYAATASLVLENIGGVPFNAAIKARSTSIGPCVAREIASAGLRVYNNNPGFNNNVSLEAAQTYVPPNAKIPITIQIDPCADPRMASVDVSATLTILVEGKSFDLSVNAFDVPVK